MRRLTAPRAYYFYTGGWTLLWELSVTLMILFQVQVAHLNPLQLVILGTVLEATIFVGEVPTGVVADLVSRRLSVLIGLVLTGVAFVMQPLLPGFWWLVAAQVVWALGWTFTSGAIEAWITDEVGEDHVRPVFTRGQQLSLVFGIGGTILTGVVALRGVGTPMLVGGVGYLVLAAILAVVMPEQGFHPTPKAERETFTHIKHTLGAAVSTVRRPGMVRGFMIVALLGGLTSEVFDRLWTPWVLANFHFPSWPTANPVIWFTLITLIGNVIALVAISVTERVGAKWVNDHHPTRIMALLIVVRVLATVLFALGGWLWLALAGHWLRNAAIVVSEPIGHAWLNRNVSSSARATTLSLTSQADAVGQVVGGPPFGALATRTSIPLAMLVSAALLTPGAAIYARLRPSEPGADARS